VRLIAYNIEYGQRNTKGRTRYFNPFRILRPPKNIADEIGDALSEYDPDIIGLVEVDTGSARTGYVNEAVRIAEKTDLRVDIEAKRYQGGGLQWLIRKLPYMSDLSNAVLSHEDVRHTDIHTLNRGVKNIAIQVEYQDPSFTLLLVHLALGKRARKEQLEELVNRTKKIDGPLLVCGDFNTFHLEELHPLLSKTRLRDSNLGRDIALTHPTWDPKYQVDNVLLSEDINVHNYEVLDEELSDHFPILVDFEITP
jgi:endonuclease/exonuclease/phosphatase family metal-dependent hydrolase